jgi:ABC-2 type transport system permease protein
MHNYICLIKRELWEHRGRFLITPLVVSGVILLTVLYAVAQLGHANLTIDGNGIHVGVVGVSGNAGPLGPFHFAAYMGFSIPFFMVTFFVTVYYTLDTLYADRRDRSILFWKSLPISDTETVVSKLIVATVVAPLITLVVALATLLIVYVMFSIGLAAHGQDFSRIWLDMPIFENLVLMVYALIVVALWYLPIWAWCMLASSWAQRAVFLWATVPIAALWFLEYQTLGTNVVANFLRIRFSGMMPLAAHIPPEMIEAARNHSLTTVHLSDVLTPGVFFSSGQLWIGVAMAAGFVVATVWVRRYRETN